MLGWNSIVFLVGKGNKGAAGSEHSGCHKCAAFGVLLLGSRACFSCKGLERNISIHLSKYFANKNMFDMLKLTFLTTLTPFRLEDDVVCLETSKTRYMQCTILSDRTACASQNFDHVLKIWNLFRIYQSLS